MHEYNECKDSPLTKELERTFEFAAASFGIHSDTTAIYHGRVLILLAHDTVCVCASLQEQ